MIKKKDFGILLVLCLIILPIASASPEVALTDPDNTNYTHTLNIPLTFSTTGSPDNCYWTIDDGIVNTSINCDPLASTKFSVNYNGDYNFTLYVEETANSSIVQDSIFITVDNNFSEGVGVIAGSIVTLILFIAFFFLICSKVVKDNLLKPLFFLFSLIMSLASVYYFQLTVLEFVKNPNIESVLVMLSNVIGWGILFVSFIYFLITIVKNVYKGQVSDLEWEDEVEDEDEDY